MAALEQYCLDLNEFYSLHGVFYLINDGINIFFEIFLCQFYIQLIVRLETVDFLFSCECFFFSTEVILDYVVLLLNCKYSGFRWAFLDESSFC